MYVHGGTAACSTRSSRPPTVSTAARETPVFADVDTLRVAGPFPLSGVTVTQFGWPATSHAHPCGELNDTETRPPDGDALISSGVRLTLQISAARCSIVTLSPATTMAADRAGPVLANTRTSIRPSPDFVSPGTVSQSTPDCDVHVQPAWVVTPTRNEDAFAGTSVKLTESSANVHGGGTGGAGGGMGGIVGGGGLGDGHAEESLEAEAQALASEGRAPEVPVPAAQARGAQALRAARPRWRRSRH